MSTSRFTLIAVAAMFALSSCSALTANDAERIATAVQGTLEARATSPAAAELPTIGPSPAPSQEPTATPTLAPTSTSEPTALPALASVSLVTNCRTGPGTAYARVFVLDPGQEAQVMARSSVDDYWYIANPDEGSELCWLWGKFATVEGDTSALPVFTPEPSPTASQGFTMYVHSSSECGSTRVVLTVSNHTGMTFRSARLQIEDVTASNNIIGPKIEPFPFSFNPSSCPRDKDNSLPPGAVAYVMIPMSDFTAGNQALAHVRLCTEDDAGGECVTKSIYFRLPND